MVSKRSQQSMRNSSKRANGKNKYWQRTYVSLMVTLHRRPIRQILCVRDLVISFIAIVRAVFLYICHPLIQFCVITIRIDDGRRFRLGRFCHCSFPEVSRPCHFMCVQCSILLVTHANSATKAPESKPPASAVTPPISVAPSDASLASPQPSQTSLNLTVSPGASETAPSGSTRLANDDEWDSVNFASAAPAQPGMISAWPLPHIPPPPPSFSSSS